MNLLPGSQRITADSVIGTSGRLIRVYNVSLVSGGTASVLSLKNGTSASGTEYVSITGIVNSGTVVNFQEGILFPGGLFADADVNISSATITYTEEL